MKAQKSVVTITLLALLLQTSSLPAVANWLVTGDGKVVYQPEGQVLGKTDNPAAVMKAQALEDDTNDDVDIEEEAETDAESESPGNSAAAKERKETKVKVVTQNKNEDKMLKITTKGNKVVVVQNGETEMDEYELSTETGTPSGSLEIEERNNKNKVKIRSHEDTAYVIQSKTAAKSRFPLMVNLDTNELIVTTPKGSKVVTVLPDAAIRNMLAANVLDQLGGKGGLAWLEYQEELKNATKSADLDDDKDSDASDSGQMEEQQEATDSGKMEEPEEETPEASESATPEPSPTPEVVDEVDNVIELTTTTDGTLVYEIKGQKVKKLLFLFPVTLDRIAVVSAETGELIQVEQDLRTRLLDLLSA